MNDSNNRFKLHNKSPVFQLFVSLLIIMGVGLTLSVILILAGMLFFGSDLAVLEKAASELKSNDYAFLRYILIIQDISLFIIPSGIIMILMKSESSAFYE